MSPRRIASFAFGCDGDCLTGFAALPADDAASLDFCRPPPPSFALLIGAQVIGNPAFDPHTYNNDITLLELERPATLPAVSRLALGPPQGGPFASDADCNVFGWGLTDPNNPSTSAALLPPHPRVRLLFLPLLF